MILHCFVLNVFQNFTPKMGLNVNYNKILIALKLSEACARNANMVIISMKNSISVKLLILKTVFYYQQKIKNV